MSSDRFIGRDWEIQKLKEFSNRSTAGLVVCRGRRQIGKSTLIEHFSTHDYPEAKFIELYGLAPRENLTFSSISYSPAPSAIFRVINNAARCN